MAKLRPALPKKRTQRPVCRSGDTFPCGFSCKNQFYKTKRGETKETQCKNVLKGQAKNFMSWQKTQAERLDSVNAKRGRVGLAPVKTTNAMMIDPRQQSRARTPSQSPTPKANQPKVSTDEKGKFTSTSPNSISEGDTIFFNVRANSKKQTGGKVIAVDVAQNKATIEYRQASTGKTAMAIRPLSSLMVAEKGKGASDVDPPKLNSISAEQKELGEKYFDNGSDWLSINGKQTTYSRKDLFPATGTVDQTVKTLGKYAGDTVYADVDYSSAAKYGKKTPEYHRNVAVARLQKIADLAGYKITLSAPRTIKGNEFPHREVFQLEKVKRGGVGAIATSKSQIKQGSNGKTYELKAEPQKLSTPGMKQEEGARLHLYMDELYSPNAGAFSKDEVDAYVKLNTDPVIAFGSVLVRQTGGEQFEVVGGKAQYLAAKMAGTDKVWTVVADEDAVKWGEINDTPLKNNIVAKKELTPKLEGSHRQEIDALLHLYQDELFLGKDTAISQEKINRYVSAFKSTKDQRNWMPVYVHQGKNNGGAFEVVGNQEIYLAAKKAGVDKIWSVVVDEDQANALKAMRSVKPNLQKGKSTSNGKVQDSDRLFQHSTKEGDVIVKNYPDVLEKSESFQKYIAKGDRPNILGDTLSPRSVPTHQMRYKDYHEAIKTYVGNQGYTDDGINRDHLNYKKAVDTAIASGVKIHPDVMKDYEGLDLSTYGDRGIKEKPESERSKEPFKPKGKPTSDYGKIDWAKSSKGLTAWQSKRNGYDGSWAGIIDSIGHIIEEKVKSHPDYELLFKKAKRSGGKGIVENYKDALSYVPSNGRTKTGQEIDRLQKQILNSLGLLAPPSKTYRGNDIDWHKAAVLVALKNGEDVPNDVLDSFYIEPNKVSFSEPLTHPRKHISQRLAKMRKISRQYGDRRSS